MRGIDWIHQLQPEYNWYIWGAVGNACGIIVAFNFADSNCEFKQLLSDCNVLAVIIAVCKAYSVFLSALGILACSLIICGNKHTCWGASLLGVALLLVFFVAGFIRSWICIAENARNSWQFLEGRKVTVEAVIVTAPNKGIRRQRLLTEASIIRPRSLSYLPKIKLFVMSRKTREEAVYTEGEYYQFSGLLRPLRGTPSPEGFDYVSWYHRNGIHQALMVCVEEPCLGPQDYSANNLARQLRLWLKRRFQEVMTHDTAALSMGILLGDASFLDAELQRAFYNCGTGHLLAASGVNTFLIAVVVCFLVQKLLRLPRVICAVPVGLAVWFYMMLAGCSPYIVRASCMGWLVWFCVCCGRRLSSWRILLLEVLLLTLWRPDWLFQVGFQMSFVAVGGIILWFRPVEIALNSVPNHLRQTLVFFFSAFVAILPLQIYYFRECPLTSILAEILVTPAVELLFIVSSLTALLVTAPMPVLLVPTFICELLCKWSIWWAKTLSEILPPVAVPVPPVNLIIVYYLTHFFLRWLCNFYLPEDDKVWE